MSTTALGLSLGLSLPASSQHPADDPLGGRCGAFVELRCRIGYDWRNCRCIGDLSSPRTLQPQPLPNAPATPNTMLAQPRVGTRADGASSYWWGNTFVINNPGQVYADDALSAQPLGEFQLATRLQLWPAQQVLRAHTPVVGILIDASGPGGFGEGAIFLGKNDRYVLVEQLQQGSWRAITRYYVGAQPTAADLFQVVRMGGAIRAYFNGYEMAVIPDNPGAGLWLKYYAGATSVAAFQTSSLYTR